MAAGFLGVSVVKNLPANAGAVSSIPVGAEPLEKETATYSTICAWEVLWTEEPLVDHSTWGLKRIGNDLVTKQQQLTLAMKYITN